MRFQLSIVKAGLIRSSSTASFLASSSCPACAQASADPSWWEESDAAPNRSDRQTNVRPPGENAPRRGWPDYGWDTPSLRLAFPGAFFIPIVAQFYTRLSYPSPGGI